MQHRQDLSTLKFLLKPMLIPFCIGVINGDESRCLWGWRMCISVLSITTIDFVAQLSGEREEEALNWLFNTGRLCGSNAM